MNNDGSTEVQIAYIHGRIEAQIEAFAISIGIPARQLAARVGILLLTPEMWEAVGAGNRVPRVPRQTDGRKAVAEVEVAQRPHGKPHVRKAQSKGAKKLWDSLSPHQKKEKIAKMHAGRLRKKEAA